MRFNNYLLLFLLFTIAAVAHAQSTARGYAGTWEGTYTAAQGTTRVVVVIEALDSMRVTGHYLFFADNSNPSVPTGHYTIEGTVDPGTGFLTVTGRKWIIRPKHYIFVGFSGGMSTDRRIYTGEVSVGKIGVVGTFTVERLTSIPQTEDNGAMTGER
jgi:hypothetical protein